MAERIEELKEEEKAAMGQKSEVCGGHQGWILGMLLIGLGLMFLFSNVFNVALIGNWWALFILIPAAANLNRAWSRYQAAGRWTDDARGSLIGGLLISAIAFIFLFNLSWGLFWPVLLIVLGVGLLLKAV